MSLLERVLRWYTGRPRQVADPARLADLENEYDAEQARAERQRRQAEAEATCAAEGHVEPDDDGVDIYSWGQRAPLRTIRCCTRCGINLTPASPVDAANAGLNLSALVGGTAAAHATAHLLGYSGSEIDAMDPGAYRTVRL